MDDREFFDKLFQLFTKTTQAEGSYWMPEAQEDGSGRFYIWAVDKDQKRKRVTEGLKEADADFITALHGCFPDLIRFTLKHMDEAERLDIERDSLTGELFKMSKELERYTDEQ
jgi:hypothetical protein